ncbi:hypothetical protein FACS1894107_01260 [Planctomycetales bacterium]|nr:hypothetical protein FACS1894107_01260 [Planctomycetales bacterium]
MKWSRYYQLEDVFEGVTVKKATQRELFVYKTLFEKYDYSLLTQPDGVTHIIQDLDQIDLSKPPAHLGGYWRSSRYSRIDPDSAQQTFRFKLQLNDANRQMLAKIQAQKCPVALQIRRGDYVGIAHDVTTPQYFQRGIEHIISSMAPVTPHFFVFSDEIEYCKQLLKNNREEFTFVEINDNDHGVFDMYLMTKCRHFVISNSTFGFWGAMLSREAENKIVVMPDRWLKGVKERMVSPYKGWVNISVD